MSLLFAPEIEGVIFDMDGVLLDTEPLYSIAYDRMLAPFGKRLDRETKLEIMGRPAAFSARHVIEKLGVPVRPEDFLEQRKPLLEELFRSAPAFPGAEELIVRLAAAGKRLALATSTGRALFELKTAAHPWFSRFDAIVCGDDPEVSFPKPAPDIFLVARQRLGIEPGGCLVVEDSLAGLEAAAAAGLRTVAVVPEGADAPLYERATLRVLGLRELLSSVVGG